ncbi:MAG: hypothetical protein IT204_09040 [Fimbriimonadaceae bacterium]|nr:hypothetical protein [Fimbriimonadaceae bacterium]
MKLSLLWCRGALVAILLSGLATSAEAAGRAALQLTRVPAGSEFIGWNEDATCVLPLPAGWQVEAPERGVVRCRLAEGATFELQEGESLRLRGAARPSLRAGFVRGRQSGDEVVLALEARRIDFAGGALFEGEASGIGRTGQGIVTRLDWTAPRAVELRYAEPLLVTFDRLQWQAASGHSATVAAAVLPVQPWPSRLRACGLWSPAGVKVEVGGGSLAAEAEALGWLQLDGQTVRPQPVDLSLPRAELWVRQPTLRARARVALAGRLREPSGLLAEDVLLTVDGAPGLVGYQAAAGPAALETALTRLDEQRSGAGHAGEEPLVGVLRDYLLPAWYGLWYHPDGREELRLAPALARFTSDYAAAVTAAAPRLRGYLSNQAGAARELTLAQTDEARLALAAMVNHLAGQDTKLAIWWSVYLSDLLSDLAGAAVCYWHGEQTLTSAAADPGRVRLGALADRLDANWPTGLQQFLAVAVEQAGQAPELRFQRLAPDEAVAVGVLVEVQRGTPVGRYEAHLGLAGQDHSAPLVVHVQPSLGRVALVGLAAAVPFALLLAAAGRVGRRRRQGP